jgi:cell pole-organizing protein PopZ
MSAASAKTQEPSMEEILASIRRIIAEDQDVAKEPEAEAAEEESADEDAGAEDVLELPEPVAFAAPEPEPEPEAQAEPEAEPEPEPEPLPDLDVAVPEILFSDEPRAPEPVVAPPPPEPVRPLEAVIKAATRPPEPERVDNSAITEALLSSTAGASVGQAFNMLSHTVLTQNARTLEDLVKDMLKPMLKVWLDDNLPPLVERLVRAEIERVARGRN